MPPALGQNPNVIEYGERPFRDCTFILHTDIGLAPYRDGANAEYLCQSSLKLTQYTGARLPIVAPDFQLQAAPNICSYAPENKQSW